MPFKAKKEQFLANSANKQKCILMLDESMKERGIQTHLAKCDAGVLIVQTVVESATSHVTTVIGEDTDLLVLLCWHADPNSCSLIFKSERRKMLRVWNIRWVQNVLGPHICNLLPFAHAIAGCDTTSRLFGKDVALQKLSTDVHLILVSLLPCQHGNMVTSAAGDTADGCKDHATNRVKVCFHAR